MRRYKYFDEIESYFFDILDEGFKIIEYNELDNYNSEQIRITIGHNYIGTNLNRYHLSLIHI
jgi:hypothetical protein